MDTVPDTDLQVFPVLEGEVSEEGLVGDGLVAQKFGHGVGLRHTTG